MAKPLIVYKASAGSGKTFTLATEYITQLIKNPTAYRSILAVTFTNKATEEMKMRILSQLYGLAQGYDDSQDYMEVICAKLDCSPAFVSRQAAKALQTILHHYSYFRVETIDSFFQSVLRNLARELDLTANLRIELNDGQVEEQAVDQLIEGLTFDDDVMKWVLDYIYTNIADDKTWNVIGPIKQFGKTIFKDFYKAEGSVISQTFSNPDFYGQFVNELRKMAEESAEMMKQIGVTFLEIIESNNLSVEDFPYNRNGIAGFFLKLSQGIFDSSIIGKRILDASGDATKWYSKKSPMRSLIHQLAESELMELTLYALQQQSLQWKRYQSARLTLGHLSQLRLLDSIERKVRQINDASGQFLLSDTQQLLHSLIRDDDSPFIFEKIGTQLEHVMIDEFQDTSSVQWNNFKVLLRECMSHEQSESLIVGDVKQSIYRWRSGDWRLLNNIEGEIPHHEEMMDIKTLDTNYRSQANIIRFNNTFFRTAARHEYESLQETMGEAAEQLKKAYADVEQKIPQRRTKAGRVEVTLLAGRDHERRTLDTLVETVGRLLQEGAKPEKIAILVRSNRLIPIIAHHFATTMPEIPIVSDEAFRLDASIAVNIIIQALWLLRHPDDALARAILTKLYLLNQGKDDDNDIFLDRKAFSAALPEELTDKAEELTSLPLQELIERIYQLFGLQHIQGQSAYISTFYDEVNRFTSRNHGDIDAFVHEWERNIGGKTIHSEQLEGIRMVSIHKSKGLEFDNVIIPFCDWQMEKVGNVTLWCKPKEAPFNRLPLVPADYSRKGMTGTVYEEDYNNESFQNRVDNLNLLYVAFTRASNNLFVIGRRDAKNSRSTLIQECMEEVAEQLDDAQLDGTESPTGDIHFGFGQPYYPEAKKKKTSQNVFMQSVGDLPVVIETFENKVEFKQSNQSRDFIDNDSEEESPMSYIKLGKILHNVFSTIHTADDVEAALRQLEIDGLLYDETVTYEKISTMLRKRLSDPHVADWFSGRWTLHNECSILTTDPLTGTMTERRPDRVMEADGEMIVVDFKFGKSRMEYHEQVKEYIRLLQQMGHPNVKGYLWFVYTNKIVEVE